MSKKRWLGVIILCVIAGYFVIFRIFPAVGASIDQALGGFIIDTKTTVESTWVWQKYDVWFSGAFFTFVTVLIMWKGHGVYNAVAQRVHRRHYREVTGTPPLGPTYSTPPGASVRPEPQKVTVEVKQPPPVETVTAPPVEEKKAEEVEA